MSRINSERDVFKDVWLEERERHCRLDNFEIFQDQQCTKHAKLENMSEATLYVRGSLNPCWTENLNDGKTVKQHIITGGLSVTLESLECDWWSYEPYGHACKIWVTTSRASYWLQTPAPEYGPYFKGVNEFCTIICAIESVFEAAGRQNFRSKYGIIRDKVAQYLNTTPDKIEEQFVTHRKKILEKLQGTKVDPGPLAKSVFIRCFPVSLSRCSPKPKEKSCSVELTIQHNETTKLRNGSDRKLHNRMKRDFEAERPALVQQTIPYAKKLRTSSPKAERPAPVQPTIPYAKKLKTSSPKKEIFETTKHPARTMEPAGSYHDVDFTLLFPIVDPTERKWRCPVPDCEGIFDATKQTISDFYISVAIPHIQEHLNCL